MAMMTIMMMDNDGQMLDGALALALAQAGALLSALTQSLALSLTHIAFKSFIKIHPLAMAVMMTDYDAWCIDTGAGTDIGIVTGTGIDIGTAVSTGTATCGTQKMKPTSLKMVMVMVIIKHKHAKQKHRRQIHTQMMHKHRKQKSRSLESWSIGALAMAHGKGTGTGIIAGTNPSAQCFRKSFRKILNEYP
jgi:hypothetical protein